MQILYDFSVLILSLGLSLSNFLRILECLKEDEHEDIQSEVTRALSLLSLGPDERSVCDLLAWEFF